MKSFFVLFWSVITISIVTQQITLTAISPFCQYDSQVFFFKDTSTIKVTANKICVSRWRVLIHLWTPFLWLALSRISFNNTVDSKNIYDDNVPECLRFMSIVHYNYVRLCPSSTCRIPVNVSENAFAYESYKDLLTYNNKSNCTL